MPNSVEDLLEVYEDIVEVLLLLKIFVTEVKLDGVVVILHICPQSCMPIPVEGLLEVYEDMVDILLVLEIFLIEDS